ncbi:Wzz/FepE/Etk N-terminal domain-containing protein [uncultured Streptococcus sp.]|uniref:Wzz/FepE/Etk N-terminal domain-containing protein n=1 Tax=uncultured Streptococcus sp. TaxID=83427 RepID=UPI0026658AC2|nr:Wzz/FepE/Etk N-terminal domain-containing protein [uncultured Streptococcus sp.]
MKLFRHLKEKRYLILAFTLPALLLALAIVFFRPTHHHAEVGVRVSTKQSSSKAKAPSKSSSSSSSSSVSTSSESSSSSSASVAANQAQATTTTTVTPAPSSAQGTYQAPQYNYAPPTTYTESQNDASTSTIYNGDVNSTVAE